MPDDAIDLDMADENEDGSSGGMIVIIAAVAGVLIVVLIVIVIIKICKRKNELLSIKNPDEDKVSGFHKGKVSGLVIVEQEVVEDWDDE